MFLAWRCRSLALAVLRWRRAIHAVGCGTLFLTARQIWLSVWGSIAMAQEAKENVRVTSGQALSPCRPTAPAHRIYPAARRSIFEVGTIFNSAAD